MHTPAELPPMSTWASLPEESYCAPATRGSIPSMRRLLTVLLMVAVTGASLGCRTRLGDLSIASTKNVALNPSPERRSVEGRDCMHMFLFIPLGKMSPVLDEALDRAMEQVPDGNIMTNVAIYNDIIFTLLYNRSCFRVRGDVGIQQ